MVSAQRVNRNRGSVLYVKKGEQSLNVLTRTVVDFIIKSVSNWINFQRARNAHYINAGPVQAGPQSKVLTQMKRFNQRYLTLYDFFDNSSFFSRTRKDSAELIFDIVIQVKKGFGKFMNLTSNESKTVLKKIDFRVIGVQIHEFRTTPF